MILTILSGVTLGLLGLFGLFRGVRRGLVAVAGTLLGAVLIDLWQIRWSTWLRAQMEQPAWVTFLLTAAIFLLVALLVGYGGSLLLPRPNPKAKKPGLFDHLIGALLGALNGALIVSYLLRYAVENWPAGEAEALIAASPITRLLDTWLPWFILAMVVSTTVFVMLRGAVRLTRALNPPAPAGSKGATQPAGATAARKPATAAGMGMPPVNQQAGQPAQPAQGAQAGQPAQPRTAAEAERILLEKIMQAQATSDKK
ncbi:MAG: hypothetical protein HGA65_20410 [Oscillochloris sp.]|nr:hypothetical protein [Oscillochloris sp.]